MYTIYTLRADERATERVLRDRQVIKTTKIDYGDDDDDDRTSFVTVAFPRARDDGGKLSAGDSPRSG